MNIREWLSSPKGAGRGIVIRSAMIADEHPTQGWKPTVVMTLYQDHPNGQRVRTNHLIWPVAMTTEWVEREFLLAAEEAERFCQANE